MKPQLPARASKLLGAVFAIALVAAGCASDGDESQVQSVDDFVTETIAGTTESAGEEIDFRFETFDGQQQALSTFTDKPVVLNFFGSWCPTCIAEMPDFEAVSQAFTGDVQFLGLAFQDRQQNAEALVRQTGVTYPAALDDGGEVFNLIGGLGMPTTAFIDADGVVRDVHSGVLSQEALTDKINELLLS